MWASDNGHTEIVKMLLEQEGIDINAKDIFFLIYFLIYQNNNWNFSKLLCTALMCASEQGHTEIVKLFHDKRIKIS